MVAHIDIIGLEMGQLSTYLKNRFAEISSITESSDGTYFMVDFAAGTEKLNLVIKEMDALIKKFLAVHGDPETAYGFNINCGRRLVNNIWYNDPDFGHRIELQFKGRKEKLFVADVMGATGEYSIFNEDFEYLGDMYMPASREEEDYGIFIFPDWSRPEKWKGTTKLIRPYVKKIVEQIAASLHRRSVLIPVR